MTSVKNLIGVQPLRPVLREVGIDPSTYYRWWKVPQKSKARIGRKNDNHPRKLSPTEVKEIVEVLHEQKYVDKTINTIFYKLLDNGVYLASISTFYRIMSSLGEVVERRRQRAPRKTKKPVLVATTPNQVWTWDISKLKTEVRGVYLNLYVIIDMYSRYIVGWMVAEKETQELASRLFEETILKQKIPDDQKIIVHSDRGSVMKSEALGALLMKHNGLRSFSRPRVSNDNPYSESNFKTVKYCSMYPEAFKDIKMADHCIGEIVEWYNNDHYHSGIGNLHPADVHFGNEKLIVDKRNETMMMARAKFPERFNSINNYLFTMPKESWINKPVEYDVGSKQEVTTK